MMRSLAVAAMMVLGAALSLSNLSAENKKKEEEKPITVEGTLSKSVEMKGRAWILKSSSGSYVLVGAYFGGGIKEGDRVRVEGTVIEGRVGIYMQGTQLNVKSIVKIGEGEKKEEKEDKKKKRNIPPSGPSGPPPRHR